MVEFSIFLEEGSRKLSVDGLCGLCEVEISVCFLGYLYRVNIRDIL